MSEVLNGAATSSGRWPTTLILALPCSPGAGSGRYACAVANAGARRRSEASRIDVSGGRVMGISVRTEKDGPDGQRGPDGQTGAVSGRHGRLCRPGASATYRMSVTLMAAADAPVDRLRHPQQRPVI